LPLILYSSGWTYYPTRGKPFPHLSGWKPLPLYGEKKNAWLNTYALTPALLTRWEIEMEGAAPPGMVLLI